MQDRCTYEYAIIRIVPKVEREEFFNVGVIIYSKGKKFVGIKYHINPDKLKAFCSEVEVDVFYDYLHAWKLICEGAPSGGKIGQMEISDRFRWLTASRSTIIQSSKTNIGLTNEPEKTLEDLFKKYIL